MHQAHGKLVMPNPVVIVPVIPATGHAGSARARRSALQFKTVMVLLYKGSVARQQSI
jgi:hypothetical protein